MGYRNYLGSLPKSEYDVIKNMTLKELYEYKNEEWGDDPYDMPGHVGVYDVAYNTHYELGKYVDTFNEEFYRPVFQNEETQKHFQDEHDFYIVEKEFVEEILNYYTNNIRSYYKKLLKPFFEGREITAGFIKTKETPITEDEMSGIYGLIEHIKDMGMEWGVNNTFNDDERPYNLTSPDKNYITSWKYEYGIFNLVFLYHNFDWENNVMIYYGY